MLPLTLVLIKTKNRHLFDPLHWSENAHFTWEIIVWMNRYIFRVKNHTCPSFISVFWLTLYVSRKNMFNRCQKSKIKVEIKKTLFILLIFLRYSYLLYCIFINFGLLEKYLPSLLLSEFFGQPLDLWRQSKDD